MSSPRRVLRWARQRVETLPPVPSPWDVAVFAERVAEQRGRPIELIPRPMSNYASVATGLWIKRDDRDQVVYDIAGTQLHRDHVICHELAHMLCDHQGISIERGLGVVVHGRGVSALNDIDAVAGRPIPPAEVMEPADEPARDGQDVLRLLAAAGRAPVLHRTAYDDAQELQAETLAFVIWQYAELELVRPGREDMARLFAALEHR